MGKKKLLKKPKKTLLNKKALLNKLLVIFFLILAFVFRVIHLKGIEKNDPTFYNLPYGTDMVTYDNYAKEILQGKHPTPYYYGPLYSYFLAVIYFIFGHDLYIARLIQMILGVGMIYFIYRIADIVFGRNIAIISLILASIYDMFIIHEGLILLEALNCFLNTLSLFFLLKIEKKKYLIFSGISLGLSSLARANILLFFPFIFLWMIFKFKKRGIYNFALLSIITLITIFPATIMNYIASKKFILISTNGPINLWIGNNPKADGTYFCPPKPKHLEKRIKEIGDKAYIEEVVRFIKEDTDLFLNLLVRKFFLFWAAYEEGNNMNYSQIKGWSPIMKLPFFIGFGTIAPLALFGMFLSLKRRNVLLLHFYALSSFFSLLMFFILGRYRIIILPAFIIFSAFAIFWVYERIRNASYKKRNASYKKLMFIFPLLIFSFLLVWNKEIYAFFFPFINSSGRYIQKENVTIIKDVSDEWRGGDVVAIGKGGRVKKELVLNKDLSLYKSAELSFKYAFDGNPGILNIIINDKKHVGSIFSTQGLVKMSSIPIEISLLKRGINSFVFELETDGWFALLYDTSYSFKRSYEFKEGGFKRIKKGEFIVELSLK